MVGVLVLLCPQGAVHTHASLGVSVSPSPPRTLLPYTTHTTPPTHHTRQPTTHRTSWTPDGESLIAMNSCSQQHPTFACFVRGEWDTFYEMAGHKSAVLVSAANPRLFYPPAKLLQQRKQLKEEDGDEEEEEGEEEEGSDGEGQQQHKGKGNAAGGGGAGAAAKKQAAAANGGGGSREEEEVLSFGPEAVSINAAGSNDRSITVWNSELARPLLQVKQV